MKKKQYTIEIPEFLACFYEKIGENAGFSAERVMADMLFKMAGEVSVRALREGSVEIEDIEMSMEGFDEEEFKRRLR